MDYEGHGATLAAQTLLAALVWGFCCLGCCACCGKRPCCCCCLCRRRAAAARRGASAVQVGDATVPVEHLRRKKELGVAYFLWCSAGLLGAHHFYLERVAHGALAAWSVNFFAVGWVADAFLLPAYTRGANRQTAGAAPSDGGAGRVCCKLPCALMLAVAAVSAVLVQVPRALRETGGLDVDRAAARTRRNPYDALGVPRGAGIDVAERAYRRQVGALAGKVCGATCRSEEEELGKAMAFINGSAWRRRKHAAREQGRRTARAADDDAWDDWSDFVMIEWTGILDSVKAGLLDLDMHGDDL